MHRISLRTPASSKGAPSLLPSRGSFLFHLDGPPKPRLPAATNAGKSHGGAAAGRSRSHSAVGEHPAARKLKSTRSVPSKTRAARHRAPHRNRHLVESIGPGNQEVPSESAYRVTEHGKNKKNKLAAHPNAETESMVIRRTKQNKNLPRKARLTFPWRGAAERERLLLRERHEHPKGEENL